MSEQYYNFDTPFGEDVIIECPHCGSDEEFQMDRVVTEYLNIDGKGEAQECLDYTFMYQSDKLLCLSCAKSFLYKPTNVRRIRYPENNLVEFKPKA